MIRPGSPAMSAMNEYIVDVTQNNAQQVLIEASYQRPVLVDFWAEWCAPCRTLMPLLEKLAREYDGALLLARVDCDSEQALAAQFGVQSLPTVILMKEGQPVDGFTRSEEHTSELQSRGHLVCRLLLEKKKKQKKECIARKQPK